MFSRGKIGLLFLLVIILTIIGCSNQNKSAMVALNKEDQSKLDMFNQTADELYQNAKAGQKDKARIKADQLGNLLLEIPLKNVLTTEGLKALSDAVVEAKRVFVSVKSSPDTELMAAAKVRLAADALVHRTNPMWLQYDKVLQEDLHTMETAVQQNQLTMLEKAVQQFEQHYLTIRTSMLISREPSQVEMVDSFIAYMKLSKQSKTPNFSDMNSAIERFKSQLGLLFVRSKQDRSTYVSLTSTHHPIIWSMLLGAFIALILSFAAWRMYPQKSGLPRGQSRVRRDKDLHF